ncbi:MAG TPA: SET domain-containing protein-lysine N-methyltransferase [Bryobacteraceae bacterium]|jgi:hypothetical protein|nr:SET domain-containing protein-lysine N-methyltransferase [Bryobacteraceae bacterium]
MCVYFRTEEKPSVLNPQSVIQISGRIPLEEAGVIERRARGEDWLGIFAVRAVPQGAPVLPRWHEDFWTGLPGWREFTADEILALPRPQRVLAFRYGLDIDFGRIVAPLDDSFVTTLDNFLNHSCEPNLGYDLDGNVITMREISPDEELTIDYGCFAVNFDEPWECRCGTPSCRGQILNTDWKQLAARYGLAMPRFVRSRIIALVAAKEPLL